MDLASLRDRLFRLLPILIIVMTIFGIVLYVARFLLPGWQTYEGLASGVATQQAVIETQIAAQDNSDSIIILQSQVERIETQLYENSAIFLSRAEADEVLNRLYSYAYARGVRVITLESQQTDPATPTAEAPAYETTILRLQVNGPVANLLDFIAHIREASLPGVNIGAVSVSRAEGETSLSMTVYLYTSPYASGQVLAQLPSPTPSLPAMPNTAAPTPGATSTPTPTETFTATTMPPTFTPTFTTTATLSPTVAAEGTQVPPLPPLPTEALVQCPGAPASLFHIGDIVVVDFNGLGALRVLADPNGSVMATRTQAYDNDQLEIIAGPVCVSSSYYWYIRNLSASETLGWAAEATTEQRFLCPVDNPECTDLVPAVPTQPA
jgi:hypothetical protein